MKTISCPNCGAPNLVPELSVLSGGYENIVCCKCNGVFQHSPFGTHFFPRATDQEGRPRVLRA